MTGRIQSRGSISVFFALVLTMVLAVICTSLESARQSVLSCLAAQAGEAALESVFAGYYRPLWEKYHLLFMADGPGFIPAMEELLSYYEEPGKEGSAQGIHLYPFVEEEITIMESVTAADHGGKAFLTAVGKDMETHGLTELAEALVGQSELVKEAQTVSDYIGSLSEYEEEISKIEENYSAMESQGKRLKSAYEGLEKALEAGTLTPEKGETLLGEARDTATETIRRTEECYERILEKAEDLKGSLEKEETALIEKKTMVSEASYEQMEAELENLAEYTWEDGSRRMEAEMDKALLEAYAGALLEISPWENGGVSKALQENLREGVEELQVFQTERSGKKQKSPLLEAIKAWKNQGILGLVIEDTQGISDRTLLEETRPSKTINAANEEEGIDETASVSERGMTVLYAVSHFGYFGEEREDAALAYEAEYILEGAESDKENLEAVVKKLLAVRSGMNFLYLLTDTEKQAEAELAAISLVGVTGIYPLIRLTKGILLGAWAFAEAICDLRILFQGGQVPLVKTKEEWKLSLQGAADAAVCETGAEAEEEGLWNYKDYLCILLLMENTEKQCFRMMDLIEADLRRKDDGFFMENCLSYALVETKFRAEPIFFYFVIPGIFSKEGYRFQKTAAYGYYD